jgi:hypothetical protein
LAVLLVLLGPAADGASWADRTHIRPAAILEVGTSIRCAYHSLETAVAAAQSGDTIKMQDTTFVMDRLDITGKDLTLAGGYESGGLIDCLTQNQYGDTTLIMSPGWAGRTIGVNNAEVSLSRFTFDGNDDGGGGLIVSDGALNLSYVNVGHTNCGLMVSSSTATLSHCGFYDNSSDVDGGGIYAFGPATLLTLTDVELRRNHADGRGGAIMLSSGAQMQADDCVIADGDANEGGGLYVAGGASALVRSSVVEGNYGWLRGAGASVRFGGSLHADEGTEFVDNKTPFGCEEGGGIYAADAGSEVTLDATLVMTNSALLRGGGLYVGNGAVAVLDNGTVVDGNEALDPTLGDGAGVYVAGAGSSLVVLEATIVGNWAANEGGGIYNSGGAVSLDGAYIAGNHAESSGGGLFNDGGTVTGRKVWIGANVTHSGQGGALYSHEGTVNLQQTAVYFNSALAGGGAAIATFDTDLALGRSYVHHNSAAGDGSVLLISGSEQAELPLARITNNMLVDNETLAGSAGSDVYVEWAVAHLWHNTHHRHEPEAIAVYAGDGSVVSLIDNIIANFAVGIRRPAAGSGQAQATYTLYYDNALDYDPDVLSTHNVYGDPLFVSPGNYHLTAGSPAIDAGMDAWSTIDYDGHPRPMGRGFDIGADEVVPLVFLPSVLKDW